jgi:hypothetical protein
MSLKSASTDIFLQLADLIEQLTDADYSRPVAVLSGNTIGKHVRHILEFYELLIVSARSRELNYDRRQRDLRLEVDTDETIRRIGSIDLAIQRLDLNQPLQLHADLSADTSVSVAVPSSFARELHYNIEHAIHHLALIQIAIRAEFPQVTLPPNFGVAYSTIANQQRAVVSEK